MEPSSGAARRPADEIGESDAPRLRRDAEDNRRRIVAAAREVFAVQGLSAGLNEVARHAGVGVGTVYRRFPDKDDLVGAVMSDKVAEMERAAHSALAFDSAWDGLVHLVETLAAMQAADRGFRDLMISPGGTVDEVQEVRDRVVPLIEQLVRQAHDEGTLRLDVSPTDIALSQVIASDFAHHSSSVRPTSYRRFLGLMLEGMRARPGLADLGESVITPAETDAIVESWLDPRAGRE